MFSYEFYFNVEMYEARFSVDVCSVQVALE